MAKLVNKLKGKNTKIIRSKEGAIKLGSKEDFNTLHSIDNPVL